MTEVGVEIDRIKLFHAHLDVCTQCERHPFDLCFTGAKLLREAATLPPLILDDEDGERSNVDDGGA